MKKYLLGTLAVCLLVGTLLGCQSQHGNDTILSTELPTIDEDVFQTSDSSNSENMSREAESKIPVRYKKTLEEYARFVSDLFSPDFEQMVNDEGFDSPNDAFSYEWFCMVIDAKKRNQ